LIPQVEILNYQRKNIVIIKIPEFPIKPLSVKGKCFKRSGSANRIMTPQEIANMYLASASMSWDAFPVQESSMEDIDTDKLKKYVTRVNEAGRRNIPDNESPLETLKKLGLINKDKPSWAAILLFGKDPSRFLPQAAIHCGRFKDEVLIIDDLMIRGTVIEQVEEGMDFLRKNLNVKFIMTGKPEREEIWDYPLEALREALINAVCHRDYSISSNTEIRIYNNELIISSPGSLPAGMTIEALYEVHSSVLRNKGIASIFYDLGLIEQWGSGIGKMRHTCKIMGMPEPVFRENHFFKVVFNKDIYTEEYLSDLGLNERQIKAVMYIKEKGRIKSSEYQQITGLSNEGVRKDIKVMMKKNIIVQKGKGRNTHYLLKSVGD
jgi:ATP-dependent DNA helicase RecG